MEIKIDNVLSYIKYFYFVCEYGGFRNAASALGVSQPTVSYAISRLEAELDTPLIDRHTKNFCLLPNGEIVYRYAESIMNNVHALNDELVNRAAFKKNLIRHSLTMYFCLCENLPLLIATHFAPQHPDIQIRLEQRNGSIVGQEILSGNCDLGIAFSQTTSDCHSIPFKAVEYGIFFKKGCSLEAYDVIDSTTLVGKAIIIPSSRRNPNHTLLNYCRCHNILIDTSRNTLDSAIIAKYVQEKDCLAILPLGIAHNQATITARRLNPPLLEELSIIWLKGRQLRNCEKLLVDFLARNG